MKKILIFVICLLAAQIVFAESNSTVTCKDIDGLDYYKYGYITEEATGWGTTLDTCVDSKVVEERVCENGRGANVYYTCPNGCQNGACIISSCPNNCVCDEYGNVKECQAIACTMPACTGAYKTGEYDSNKCPIYKCPINPCSKPSCQGVYDTDEIDENGCPIYKCPQSCPKNCACDSYGNIKECIDIACKIPTCEGAYQTGDYSEDGCPQYGCPAISCSKPKCMGLYDTDEVDENGCHIYKCPQIISCPENCKCDSEGNTIICQSEQSMETCLKDSSNYWDQETDKCYSGFKPGIIKALCSDPDGGKNIYSQAHTFGFRSYYADEYDKRIRTGGKDACMSEKQVLEHYCDEQGYIQTTYIDCPNGCSEGECIKGEEINYKIRCIFSDSNEENKCYPSEGGSGCSGKGECMTEISGYAGEQITWKSSCGGYAYTVLGQDNNAKFDCGSGEVNNTQILDKGFSYAYWECYDGTAEKQGSESSCKPYGIWKKYATESCDGRCYSGKEKCGVNSFSVSGDCYLDEMAQETTEESLPNIINVDESETGSSVSEEVPLLCKDSCPLDGKCYPFGYRKGGKYCTDMGSFEEQLTENSGCDNNFECSSNVCVDGECISGGFLRQLMDWFKGLFGSKEKNS